MKGDPLSPPRAEISTALSGEDLKVDINSIEKSLADLWRTPEDDEEGGVTRAALWNVIAHTSNHEDKQLASQALGRASASVPQRTIVIRSSPSSESHISSYISANCHILGGSKKFCSEEISIDAGGDRVAHVPPLVQALLIPSMPVAAWWLGDLPEEREDYVVSLLEPADRLIVDSAEFESVDDWKLLIKLCSGTSSAPGDLTWARLEEWRIATASLFDPPDMRGRLGSIRHLRVVSSAHRGDFGEIAESLMFTAWIAAQLKAGVHDDGSITGRDGPIDVTFDRRAGLPEPGTVAYVEIEFGDGARATLERDRSIGALKAQMTGGANDPSTITRLLSRETDELIVRQLSRSEEDVVLNRILPLTMKLAQRTA